MPALGWNSAAGVGQWTFYVLATRIFDYKAGAQKTINLASLSGLTPKPWTTADWGQSWLAPQPCSAGLEPKPQAKIADPPLLRDSA